ncbi:uncharacterized protein LOC124622649 [Schistocerca americana]|uniref:uncharacterized protein LOC124622649 n=1 Tax=Schistocerca americana TaxID=7009 RepID=UPI001F4F662E|nr:uncharacterized protein LOC124622649 [Schistocerca americana]XP_047004397.1 uncharacterized protein LOC124622649 [Schistocerca americana]
MEEVDEAEKEASEVLHSLLSVERIEKQPPTTEDGNQVIIISASDSTSSVQTETSSPQNQNNQITGGMVQWHTPVTGQQAVFASIVDNNQQFGRNVNSEQVLWQTDGIQLWQGSHQTTAICIPNVETSNVAEQETFTSATSERPEAALKVKKKMTLMKTADSRTNTKSKTPQKSKQKVRDSSDMDPTQLEENAQQVKERFEKGCECQEENCFKGLSPEYVYRHRLNIAELTKGEHDMYLMGVTMAVLTNPEETVRHKERQRLRAQYAFQGRRVCLAAFLYLENCTHYQLKRIRKHVMVHGVSPRVHGNCGKKPHNTFPLDSYRHATSFLQRFIEKHTQSSATTVNGSSPGSGMKSKSKPVGKTTPLYLPSEITRKTIHNAYCQYCENYDPSIKVMGYSTFRHFMKEQFPHVKFCKTESSCNRTAVNNQTQKCNGSNSVQVVDTLPQQCIKLPSESLTAQVPENCQETQATSILRHGQLTAIPIIFSQPASQSETTLPANVSQEQAFIVKPILHASLDGTPVSINSSGTFTSYQLAPAHPTYTTHPHNSQTIAVASIDGNTQDTFAFTTL